MIYCNPWGNPWASGPAHAASVQAETRPARTPTGGRIGGTGHENCFWGPSTGNFPKTHPPPLTRSQRVFPRRDSPVFPALKNPVSGAPDNANRYQQVPP